MKRLKGAPDLRQKRHTADHLIKVIDRMFEPKDRDALKVFTLQFVAGYGAHEAISYLGLIGRKLNSYPLEVAHKRSRHLCYSIKCDLLLKSFGNHIPESRRTEFRSHLGDVLKRLK